MTRASCEQFTGSVFACRSTHSTAPELGFDTNPHLLAGIAISGLLPLSVVLIPVVRRQP
jgi:hypothetical protein